MNDELVGPLHSEVDAFPMMDLGITFGFLLHMQICKA